MFFCVYTTIFLYLYSAQSPHMRHVRNTFQLAGYDLWDEKSETWDVMWAYEYPFPSKIKPEDIKPNQLVCVCILLYIYYIPKTYYKTYTEYYACLFMFNTLNLY